MLIFLQLYSVFVALLSCAYFFGVHRVEVVMDWPTYVAIFGMPTGEGIEYAPWMPYALIAYIGLILYLLFWRR